MGALYHFDEELPSAESKAEAFTRELGVFTYDGRVYLRISRVSGEDVRRGYSTVELSREVADELAEGIGRAMSYLGWDGN